tara:strand:+ start:247 stop:381 length:135 start_codon:yes stop_codon:yes gene_type:complete
MKIGNTEVTKTLQIFELVKKNNINQKGKTPIFNHIYIVGIEKYV